MIIYYTDGFESSREESHRLLEKALAAYTGDEKKAKKLIGMANDNGGKDNIAVIIIGSDKE